jgi:hypothetical protein
MTPLELNYNIYNKELLAIVTVLKKKEYFYKEPQNYLLLEQIIKI